MTAVSPWLFIFDVKPQGCKSAVDQKTGKVVKRSRLMLANVCCQLFIIISEILADNMKPKFLILLNKYSIYQP